MVELPKSKAFEAGEEMAVQEPAAQADTKAKKRRGGKRLVLAAALLAGLTGAAYYGYGYWTVGRFLESTDDAYVQSDYTVVAPKVSGYISEVLVHDNEPVKAGQVLARIDDRDFRAALRQAKANVEAAQAAVANADAETAQQNAVIAQAVAAVGASKATLTFAEQDDARYRRLAETGAGTVQKAQASAAARREAASRLQRDEAALSAARKKVAVLKAARGQAVAEADRALAAEEQARLDLSYATIAAPVSGTVGARSLRVGQYVTAGTQLMAVVPLHAVFVVGNFKETQITDVRAGQPATVRVDGFPGVTLAGRVDSLAPASGLEFSLLPPDNATGNFTKVVQRIPVKIAIDEGRLKGLLRPGMSVEPTVDTRGARAAGLSAPGK